MDIRVQPLSDAEEKARTEQVERRKKADEKLKHHIRVLRALQRSLGSLLSLLILLTMSGTIGKYFSTKATHPAAWPSEPTLYPTYALLAISAAVFLFDTIALFSYCCGVKTANRAASISSYVHYLTAAAHAVAWVAGAGVFKYANVNAGGTDLWGWSCSEAADVNASVNSSDLLCQTNTASFYITIVQIIVELLGFIILCMSLRRSNTKKKLAAVSKFQGHGDTMYEQVEQVEVTFPKA